MNNLLFNKYILWNVFKYIPKGIWRSVNSSSKYLLTSEIACSGFSKFKNFC